MLLLLVGVSACSPKYYIPNTQNVPLISEKGETNLTLSGNDHQVSIHGAYGILDGLAVEINGGLIIPEEADNGNHGSGNFAELGLGYFKKFGEYWVFEAYGIGGIGSMQNKMPSTIEEYPNTKGEISANMLRLGVQPNFGFKTKYFSAAISSRFMNLSYHKIQGDLMYSNESQIDYLNRNSSLFLIEPALTLRGGFEKIKLQIQGGYSLNVTKTNFRQDHLFFTIGLNAHFQSELSTHYWIPNL